MTNPNTPKIIKNLHQKKYRQETKKFLVEGTKNVQELLRSKYQIENLYITKEFRVENAELLTTTKARVQVVDSSELKSFGTLEHNDGALAIAMQKEQKGPTSIDGVVLVLDDIRDPGNLGTLIRIADWYGIKDIVCSPTCVDWYNPKVISASMGSFTRVNGFYTDIPKFFAKHKAETVGGFLNGENLHNFSFPKSGFLVIGSESHGISREVAKRIVHRVTIPKYGGAESLNAGIAGALLLDRWVEKNMKRGA